MAVDNVLIHDGTLHTAVSNFYNPAVAFLGAGGSAQFLAVNISAPGVLSVQTTPGGTMYGVLQNTPMATEACDVGILGISKAVCGSTAVVAGNECMIDANGCFIPFVFTSGATYRVGRALSSASGLGVLFSMLIYSPNIHGGTT